MSDDPTAIEADEVRGRGFPLSLRGFDPEDVRSFLVKVADALEALESGSGTLEDFPMPLDDMRDFEFETTWKGADREEVHQFLGEIADYADFRSKRQTRTSLLSGGRPRLTAVSSQPTAVASPPVEQTETDPAHAAPTVSHDETPRLDDGPAQPSHLTSVTTSPTEAAQPDPGPVAEGPQPAPADPEPEPADREPAPAPAPVLDQVVQESAAEAPAAAAFVALQREPDPRLDMSSVFDSEIGAILEHAKAAAAKITEDAERRAQDYFEGAKAEASARIEEELGEARSDLARVRRDAEDIRSDAEAARKSSDEYAQRVRSEADDYAGRLHLEADDYAERVRGEADTAAERVRGEADEYAERVRGEADEYAERVRGEADTAAEELRAESTSYAEETRRLADEYATETRRLADEYATETTAEAERLRAEADAEVQRRVEAALNDARRRLEALTTAEAEVRARLGAVAEATETLLAEPQTDLDAIIAAAGSDAGERADTTIDDDRPVDEDSHAA